MRGDSRAGPPPPAAGAPAAPSGPVPGASPAPGAPPAGAGAGALGDGSLGVSRAAGVSAASSTCASAAAAVSIAGDSPPGPPLGSQTTCTWLQSVPPRFCQSSPGRRPPTRGSTPMASHAPSSSARPMKTSQRQGRGGGWPGGMACGLMSSGLIRARNARLQGGSMRATPAELAALLAGEATPALRLEGLRVQRGEGRPAEAAPVQLAGARFVPPVGEARVLDLSGWTLLPGLCDAHLHLFHEARRRLRVDLSGLRRRAKLWERLAAAASGGEGPLIGVAWDESDWDDPRFPTRRELDALLPTRPVGLIRVCGHVAVANGEALRRLGRAAEDGLLLEGEAVALARAFPLGRAELLAAAAAAAADFARQGLTAVTDMGAAELPALASALPRDFPLRVEYFHAGPLAELPAAQPDAVGLALGRKFFLDGSIGGRTAAVAAPYVEGGRG
ncbi:amidohydrolase family protein, partial [bacterium]|nr:amidohydrolase family protein [bacterium]